MSLTGYLKLHRKMKENPVVMKDADHLAVWVWLLMETAWKSHERMFGNEKITLDPGQLITSTYQISSELHISQSKVVRILKLFKSDLQIDEQVKPYGRVITILHWNDYQCCDLPSDSPLTYDRLTSDLRLTQTEESNNSNNNKYSAETDEIISYLNQATGQHYRSSSKETKKHIRARLEEGFSVDDFKTVIDKKTSEWKGTEQQKYLRPQTLFGTKFESYLNQLGGTQAKEQRPKPVEITDEEFERMQREHEESWMRMSMGKRGDG